MRAERRLSSKGLWSSSLSSRTAVQTAAADCSVPVLASAPTCGTKSSPTSSSPFSSFSSSSSTSPAAALRRSDDELAVVPRCGRSPPAAAAAGRAAPFAPLSPRSAPPPPVTSMRARLCFFVLGCFRSGCGYLMRLARAHTGCQFLCPV
eukprot:6179966-Pleurochrysis_carterae.AAC.1